MERHVNALLIQRMLLESIWITTGKACVEKGVGSIKQ